MSELLALVKGELLVLDSLLDGKGWPLVHFKVEVTGMGAKRFGVNGGEADGSLVLLRQRLQGLC